MALGYSTSELLKLNQPTIPGCIDNQKPWTSTSPSLYPQRLTLKVFYLENSRPHAAPLNIPMILNSWWHGQTHRRDHRPSGTCLSILTLVNVQPEPVSFPVIESLQLKFALFNVRSLSNKCFLVNDLIRIQEVALYVLS